MATFFYVCRNILLNARLLYGILIKLQFHSSVLTGFGMENKHNWKQSVIPSVPSQVITMAQLVANKSVIMFWKVHEFTCLIESFLLLPKDHLLRTRHLPCRIRNSNDFVVLANRDCVDPIFLRDSMAEVIRLLREQSVQIRLVLQQTIRACQKILLEAVNRNHFSRMWDTKSNSYFLPIKHQGSPNTYRWIKKVLSS